METSLSYYDALAQALTRPQVFSSYTADTLWTDPHTSAEMLKYHLDPTVDISSRRASFIDRSATWMVDHFNLGPGKRVIDFGCGPGLYTSRLARSGAEIVGVDFSRTSIDYARAEADRAGHNISYERADYLEYEPPQKFDLIIMIMCDFCALSPGQRSKLLGTFANSLSASGRCVFDVYSLAAFQQKQEGVVLEKNLLDGFWSAAPYFGILASFKYDAESVSLDKYTIIERQRQKCVFNWLQYFSTESLEREIRRAGLTVELLLGDVAGNAFDSDSTEFAVVTRLA